MEKNLSEEVWDKKKIIVGLITAGVLVGGVFYAIKSFELKKIITNPQGLVKGVSTPNQNSESPPQAPVKSLLSAPAKEAEKSLNNIKQEVANLDIKEIASSSPQVQKVLRDIQSLEQYPRNQAKEMCENLCKGL